MSEIKTIPQLRFWLIDTGYCTASEHHVMRGGERRTFKAHALAVLLEHPTAGRILFDTGYAPRVRLAFKHFPFQFYAAMTPVTTRLEWSALAQLDQIGIKPSTISSVIVSHFHADHIGGLRDFKDSRLIASRQAFDDVRAARGFAALRRAFVPALMPNSSQQFELVNSFASEPLEPFGATHDLLGDGSLRLVSLPGHARGQVGLFAQTSVGPVLFAADGAWTSEAIRENRPPALLALRLIGDPPATVKTLRNLHEFAQANPNIWIIPTHCPEIAALITRGQPRAFTGPP
jgi:glyoxylase-like metal-dependent hydrolase (beta-lactamase superfamily II)